MCRIKTEDLWSFLNYKQYFTNFFYRCVYCLDGYIAVFLFMCSNRACYLYTACVNPLYTGNCHDNIHASFIHDSMRNYTTSTQEICFKISEFLENFEEVFKPSATLYIVLLVMTRLTSYMPLTQIVFWIIHKYYPEENNSVTYHDISIT